MMICLIMPAYCMNTEANAELPSSQVILKICMKPTYNKPHLNTAKHHDDVIWTARCLISPAIGIFIQKLIQFNYNETIKVLLCWPFALGIHQYPMHWIACAKGQ